MLTDTNEAIQGQRQSWNLTRKLGEGDAGEVYLVESILDNQPGIVKRPRKGGFFSDTLRQANQIRTEGSILRGLPRGGFAKGGVRLGVPALIDQNRLENEVGEGTFIVIERARGIDLRRLSRVTRFGAASVEGLPADAVSRYFIQEWSQLTQFAPQLLVRVLLGVINMLEKIHDMEIRHERGVQRGVIWNDVKPEHLYWDPAEKSLTVIDWGNSQFLESDGITKDRQYSGMDDFRQLISEMGSFLAEANPELYARLEWPAWKKPPDAGLADSPGTSGAGIGEEVMGALKERLERLQAENTEQLKDLRRQEAELYGGGGPEVQQVRRFEMLQRELVSHGETVDPHGSGSFMVKVAHQLVAKYNLEELEETCQRAQQLPTAGSDKWQALRSLVGVARASQETDEATDEATRTTFTNALEAGVAGDWPAALWELLASFGGGAVPEWWETISQEARRVHLGLEAEAIALYTTFARLYYTLQAEVKRLGDQHLRAGGGGNGGGELGAEGFNWQASNEVVAAVGEDILLKWKESEPSPPNSGIGYGEVDCLVERIERLLPGQGEKLERLMAQPKAQVELVLRAWEQKDFELARRGLRLILIWDPDRRRLLTAEKAILATPEWLRRVRGGAGKDEPFYDYLTSVELAGRRLRNQVGGSRWLDETLEAFKRLRKGTRSVDLLIEFPEIMHECPWLNEYASREILRLPHTRVVGVERDASGVPPASSEGVAEGKFGPNQPMQLGEALDTWMPEARGSSARVFAGTLRKAGKQRLRGAFKIIRPDQLDYALPLFIEEVQVLTLLRDVPGITPLMELGFLKLEEGQRMPGEETRTGAEGLRGQVVHYGVEQAQNYLAAMDRQLRVGWLPYLALVKRNPEHNLLRYCDASFTHGWFLPLRESLVLALQICDILQMAHDRNIVYRDHKILHYYWDVETHGVTMIDWNIAKRHPQGLAEADKQFDLVQLGARGLHHIFTGRPAAGTLPLGPNRPEDIEKASTHYPVQWTYDDERLPNPLRSILERTLNQGYALVSELRRDLMEVYLAVGGE